MSNWIFLRGLTREARHWGKFPSIFQAAIPDANIVMPDLPGNGELRHLTSPMHVCEMVEYCRQELATRGISPPYYLLALSLGAMVSVEWARRYPHELLGYVLINTSLRPFSSFYRRLRPRNYLLLLHMATFEHDAEKIELAILRMTSHRSEQLTSVVKAWVTYRTDRPVTVLNTLRQMIAAARYRAPMNRPDVPLLILAGAKDGLVDPRCSQTIFDRWKSPLHTHPEAGHDLPLDDGVWVVQRLQEWVAVLALPVEVR